jgi:autotransporter-associated beta strand protein
MTLSGTNTHSGATTINGGILNVTGAISSGTGTLSINNGGTLAGTGSVARATTVSGGGIIAPGNGGAGVSGTLSVVNALTLNNGAVLNMDLSGTANSDKIALSGSLAASGTTTINLNALAGFAGSGVYPLITSTGSISAASFALGATPAGCVCTLGAGGNSLTLTVMTPVENWRFTHFGTTGNSGDAADTADPDGDGWSNAREFASGTDPNNRASLLKVSQMQASGNDMVVSFPTVVGKTYRVERSDTLQSSSWTTVQDNIIGTGSIMQATDTSGALQPKRFYRIMVLQ